MASPVGGGGSPSRPPPPEKEPQVTKKSSITEMVAKTLALLQDLQFFLSEPEKVSSPIIMEKLRHLKTLQTNAEEIRKLAQETSTSLNSVATAMVACNIQIEKKLKENTELSRQEIASIKAALQDISEAGGSGLSAEHALMERDPPALSKTSSTEQSISKSEPSVLLPLKKRSFAQAFSKEDPSTASSGQILWDIFSATEALQPPSTHSLQAFIDLLDMTISKLPWHLSSLSEHIHTTPVCIRCFPIQKLLSCLVITENEATLKWQLQILLNHINKEQLALALLNIPEATQAVLRTQYLSDSLLALILYKCNAPESLCLPKMGHPKTQGVVYFFLEKVIALGIHNRTIGIIRRVWRTTRNPECLLKNLSIRLAYDSRCLTTKEICQEEFVKLFPKISRAYPFGKGQAAYYTSRAVPSSFIDFAFCVTVKTLRALQQQPEVADLFLKSPENTFIPHTEMFMLILSLTLLSSSSKYKIRVLSSKASVTRRQFLSFKEEESKVLSKELLVFAKSNGIKISVPLASDEL
ncbi:hypothetical protein [Chlamydiifrater volucris]|uniref:hypothetical protein n=1 Tax=Chlamydiifrater volucris TaxID=2681470 RepID=UPI001BCFEFCA|nr:hypothetical protein [Chlamydiifrater volucris]